MKNKIINLILILSIIITCTGCQEATTQAPVGNIEKSIANENLNLFLDSESYTFSKSDVLNKIDLLCVENTVCENDNWFLGSMPVQGIDPQAGEIFKQFEIDKLTKFAISEQEINDGYTNSQEAYKIMLFGEQDDKVHMIKYDLDGDGEPEIIGKCTSAPYSGTAGSGLVILKKYGNKYENLSAYVIHPYKFQVLKRNPNREFSCLRFYNDEESINRDMYFCYDKESNSYQRYELKGDKLTRLKYEK